MNPSYRDSRYAASIRIERIRERALSQDIPQELIDIHARRVARTLAGRVAIAGAVLLLLVTAWWGVVALEARARSLPTLHPTHVLMAAVVLVGASYAVARVVAAHRFPVLVRDALVSDRDELVQLARLESGGLARVAASIAGAGERQSFSMPMVGIALLAPLTIHLIVGPLFDTVGSYVDGFDKWIAISVVLVGFAHLVLADLCMRFARRVAASTLAELERKSPASGWKAYGWTLLASCFPGAIALLIPPVIVAATALPIVPLLFSRMHRRATLERRVLQGYA